MQKVLAILGVMVGLLSSTQSSAHESRPLQIEVGHLPGHILALKWRIPVTVAPDNYPMVSLEGCDLIGQELFGFAARKRAVSPLKKDQYQCDQNIDLTALALKFTYPEYNPVLSTMVVYTDEENTVHNRLFGPEVSTLTLAEVAGNGKQASEYVALGMDHIWRGYDHLLLVLCLMIIAGTFKRLLIVITGFTIAHSLTLIMAALEVVQFAVPPVEAVIALSIILLARELVVADQRTLTWQYPVAVSGILGLLHGFGFAAVLGDIGLPYDDKITALLMFNVGVEIGQLMFVFALVIFGIILQSLVKAVSSNTLTLAWVQKPLGYGVGIIASFWFIERVQSFY